jgi:predicted outer membrane repeat protein
MLTITNCIISGNSAEGYHEYSGGGIRCGPCCLTIEGSTISDNSAGYDRGGGIYCGGDLKITNCTITGNSTESGGGGVDCESATTIANSTISDNTGGWGGGICCGESTAITNCTINGNSARWVGGIYCTIGNLTVTNCTITGNTEKEGYGGGICSYNSNSTITNCILWGNLSANGHEIYISENTRNASVSYTDVEGGQADVYVEPGGVLNWGLGNIDIDPCFVGPGYWDANDIPDDANDDFWVDGDYHLLSSSPCIDAGTDAGVYDDIEGNIRPFDYPGVDNNGELPEFDMGAYEAIYINTAPVACIVGGDRTVEAEADCRARVTLDGSCSSDADSTPRTNDDINDFDWYDVVDVCDPNSDIYLGSGEIIECNLSLGEHDIILEVIDKAGAFDANEVTIIVEDATTPEFTLSVTPNVLWPPNHKMVKITPSWEISDNCDELPDVTLVSISSNEDDNSKGGGHTSDDIRVKPDGSIYLRAERSGKGTGRIYTITYRAVDDSGNVTVQSAAVTVPHNRIPTWFRRIPRDRLRHMLLRRLRSRVRRYRQRSAPVMTVSTAPRQAPRR